MRSRIWLVVLMGLIGGAMWAADDLASRREALKKTIDEEWEFEMRSNPINATYVGDSRYDDKWPDLSAAAIEADYQKQKAFRARLAAISDAGFTEQEQLNRKVLMYNLELQIEAHEAKLDEMPVDQIFGIQLIPPQMVGLMSFKTVAGYENYLKRLRALPEFLEQVTAITRQGTKDGLVPPKFLLEKVVGQAESLSDDSDASPFLIPVKRFDESIGEADRTRLTAAITEALKTRVAPAYKKFAEYVKTEYAPKGRTEEGIWSLPNGPELYRIAAKIGTTTDVAPAKIHEIGVQQVAAIEAQMTVIAKKLGFKDLASFRQGYGKYAKHPKSAEDLLDQYRKYTDQMYNKLPQLFGRLPKGRMKVEPVEAYREQSAAAAQYQPGTPDGSRPGAVQVNTGEAKKRDFLQVESTAYHEGVPGHHMQITIAQEVEGLPLFRQHAPFNAYVEGWALYSEQLGKEVGFYQDPISDYGRLSSEMLRAIRLVVDTGVHEKHWTRQQMIDYFHAHSTDGDVEILPEVDRYIAAPGQALGYKMGQLKILELREKAKKALGAKFDIRAFHDEVLGGGALPLAMLEERMNGWIASQKK